MRERLGEPGGHVARSVRVRHLAEGEDGDDIERGAEEASDGDGEGGAGHQPECTGVKPSRFADLSAANGLDVGKRATY